MPWSHDLVHNLLFKIKNALNENGHCFIPFMDKEMQAIGFDHSLLDKIHQQLQHSVETHLVMSNMDSIHILKVKNVILGSDFSVQNVLDCFDQAQNYKLWIEVDDLFVHKANHTGSQDDIALELECLLESEIRQNIFVPIQQVSINHNSQVSYILPEKAMKWVELNRNLTYDYFIRSCELEEVIYQEAWNNLTRTTQHCLIMSEQLKHKGILYKESEKLHFFKDSFEAYLSALINELNEIYIRPLVEAYHQYDSLKDVWTGMQDGIINPDLKKILAGLFAGKESQIGTLEAFLVYIQNMKTCLFSMKQKYAKRIGKEEYLMMENFLGRQENLIESFHCKKLDKKIQNILIIKNWLQSIIVDASKHSLVELKDYTLKLSHLLTIMSSTSYEDNVLFKLVEEKTKVGFSRKSFEDEVKDLFKVKDFKAA
jgi:hypothetical protein